MRRLTITEIQSKKRKIKNINENLKTQISENLQKIDRIFRKNKIKKTLNYNKDKNKYKNENENNDKECNQLNNNQNNKFDILDDLPIEQKLSIFKDSVFSLRKKISSLNEMEQILKLENEIKTKNLYLNTLQNKNKILRNDNNLINKEVNKIYKNNDTEIKKNEQLNKIENEKKILTTIKKEYREKYNSINQQNNYINKLTLNNYKNKEKIIIKKKINEEEDKDNLLISINSMSNEIKEIESQIFKDKNKYENILNEQNKIIENINLSIEKIKRNTKIRHIKNKVTSCKLSKKLLLNKYKNNNNIYNYNYNNFNSNYYIPNKRSKSAFIGKISFGKLPYLSNKSITPVLNNKKRNTHTLFIENNKFFTRIGENIAFNYKLNFSNSNYKIKEKKHYSLIENSHKLFSNKKYSKNSFPIKFRHSLTPINLGNYNGINFFHISDTNKLKK